MEIVWNAFNELSYTRGNNGYGFNAITYSEIYAWVNLTQIELTPNEIGILKLLDDSFLVHSNKRKE